MTKITNIDWPGFEFDRRLATARAARTHLVYHEGDLLTDAQLGERAYGRHEAALRAAAAWKAFLAGHCTLVQKRWCAGYNEYWAIPVENGPALPQYWPACPDKIKEAQ